MAWRTAFILTLAICIGPVDALGRQMIARKISATEGNFQGELMPGDGFGTHVVGIDDLDGDGVPDLAVTGGGALWILFLNRDGSVKDHRKMDHDGPIALAGDVNGDGLSDLAIRQDGIRLLYLSQNGSAVLSQQIAGFGLSPIGLSVVGDINGDEFPDFAVGTGDAGEGGRGGVTLYFVEPDFSSFSFAGFGHNRGGFGPIALGDNTGNAIARVNGLGTDSTFVLAVGEEGDSDRAGLVWLVEFSTARTIEQATALENKFDISIIRSLKSIDGSSGLQHPIQAGDRFGSSIASLKDLDGDGIDEIAIGAVGDYGGGFLQGSLWVITLNSDGTVKDSRTFGTGDADVSLPLSDHDQFGASVTRIGDLNGDGIPEIAVGAPGNEEEGGIWILFGLPALPPKIELVDLTEVPVLGESIIVEAMVTGTSDIAWTRLNLRPGGYPKFFSIEMDEVATGRFSYAIDSFSDNSRGIDYYVTAGNSGGGEARAPAEGFVSIPVIVPDGLDLEVPSGSAADGYRLVSFPLVLDSTHAMSLLETGLGEYDPSSWRFFSMDRFGQYVDISEKSLEVLPGYSYWLLAREASRVLNSGSGKSISTAERFPIRLERGWTLVANPFNYPIPRSNLSTQSGAPVDLRLYDGTWTDTVDVIEPFSGYAAFSEQPDTMWINPDLTPLATGTRVSESPRLAKASSDPWSITVTATAGTARDNHNVAGVATDALDGWDYRDRPEPPPVGEYVSLYFAHPDWSRAATRFNTDIRAGGGSIGSWSLSVECPTVRAVELTFDVERVPANLSVWLDDRLTGVHRDLRTRPHYRMVSGAPQLDRTVELTVGSSLRATETPVQSEFRLDVFPNPARDAASFIVTLDKSGTASLKIYDAIGRLVTEIINNQVLPAGKSAQVWDRRSPNGSLAAAGLYLARLEAGGRVLTRTVVVTD